MIQEKYINKIKEIIGKNVSSENGARFFIFGSSVLSENFSDVDLGFLGALSDGQTVKIREELEEAPIPYKFDLVDFNNVEESFRNKVLSEKIVWLI